MRFRQDSAEELARARAAVAEWRDQNPEGRADQLVAALGAQFRPDYGPVLRGILFGRTVPRLSEACSPVSSAQLSPSR